MKSATRSLDPLPNPRHEAFAREIASGQSATQAYINIYGTENRRVASTVVTRRSRGNQTDRPAGWRRPWRNHRIGV